MAKSTRSKVKRAYRAKKRDDGIYAAVEAARLERLNAKLRAVCDAPKVDDIETPDDGDAAMRGSSWLLLFGLLEPTSIGFENLRILEEVMNRPIHDAY